MCLRTTIKHFLKLFPEISCGFENKTVTLRHGFLIQLIMKQVEERYISFEASKMAYRDIKNSVDTAKREGIAEGMEIGMAKGKQEGLAEGMEKGMEKGRAEGKHEANTETAQRLLAMGLSAEQIAKATQLPLEIIKNLSNS
jgi:predicted transposase/invertase (TIGR01784 family)